MIDRRDVVEISMSALEALLEYMVTNDIDRVVLDKTFLQESLEAYETDLWPDEQEKN